MSTPKYRLTPSLLNKFQDFLDSDRLWEQFYGGSEDPVMSIEEYSAKCEQELLDACNRVPFTSEAASKGTALNEIIDCILMHRKPREDMEVHRLVRNEDGSIALCADKKIPERSMIIGLEAVLDGFRFAFDMNLVDMLTDYFFGSICQYRCEATIDTKAGPVILYGDADYIRRDIVYDLKTTTRYEFGKFSNGWQKHLYPYCLIESGDITEVSGFEYTVVPLTGGTSRTPLISGSIYREWYDYSHENTKCALVEIVEPFIDWLEAHRSQITHPRVFNG